MDEYQGPRNTISKQDENRCDGGNAQTGVLYTYLHCFCCGYIVISYTEAACFLSPQTVVTLH